MSTRFNSPSRETKAIGVCPRCDAVGKPVKLVTLKSLLKPYFANKETKMRTTVMVIVMASVLSVARGETKNTEITPERISFYEVPLVCPAAAEIGCGSRAKPILLQLVPWP